MNYWSCMNLGAKEEEGGNKTRLTLELDQLSEAGVNVIRIMASSEGATTRQPNRVYPVLRPSPNTWNEQLFVGLDRCLAEASNRGIRVIMVMGK